MAYVPAVVETVAELIGYESGLALVEDTAIAAGLGGFYYGGTTGLMAIGPPAADKVFGSSRAAPKPPREVMVSDGQGGSITQGQHNDNVANNDRSPWFNHIPVISSTAPPPRSQVSLAAAMPYSRKRQRTSSTYKRPAIARAAPRKYVKAKRRSKAPVVKMTKQLKALLGGHHKDAVDVTRDLGLSATGVQVSCLTSINNYTVATSGSGVLVGDGDQALLQYLKVRGSIKMLRTDELATALTGTTDVQVRMLYIWVARPSTVPVAAGTLPPITDFFDYSTDYTRAIPKTKEANGGRFQILSDHKFVLDRHQSNTTSLGMTSSVKPNLIILDHNLKINKTVRFVKHPTDGVPGGHFDSDYENGRVNTGLLLRYICLNDGGHTCSAQFEITDRLSYSL